MRQDETAVALLTGHMLKDPEAVTAYHFDDVAGEPRPGANRPLRVAAELPRWSGLSPMRFTVRTPASSANLGPGFDALGLALDCGTKRPSTRPASRAGSRSKGPKPRSSMAAKIWR